jgi:hypothetical protein
MNTVPWGFSRESEEDEHGVGPGVNTTLLSDTLQFIGLGESAAVRVKVLKNRIYFFNFFYNQTLLNRFCFIMNQERER